VSFLTRQENAIMESSRVVVACKWELSQRQGDPRPEHSALANYILNNDAMAHDRELGELGTVAE
jgi:hypothetical protein